MHRHLCKVLQAARIRPFEHHKLWPRKQQLAHPSAFYARHSCANLAQSSRDLNLDVRDEAIDWGCDCKITRSRWFCFQDGEKATSWALKVLSECLQRQLHWHTGEWRWASYMQPHLGKSFRRGKQTHHVNISVSTHSLTSCRSKQ